VALRLLAVRRYGLGVVRTATVNQLHRLLVELARRVGRRSPSPLPKPRRCWPRRGRGTWRGRSRRQLAVELAGIDKRIKAAGAQLRAMLEAVGTGLLDLRGIGPSGPARLLGDIGDIARFPTRTHFASWNGTAPIDASSGEQTRHRLSRAGDRRINRVLHIMAVVQLRHDSEGRAYYRRKRAAGKTGLEAMRCLKRWLSDVVYRQLVADQRRQRAQTAQAAGPGGQTGATTGSSAVDFNPDVDTSEKSLPEPVGIDPTPATPKATARSSRRSRRPKAGPAHTPKPGTATP
jgi:transposase